MFLLVHGFAVGISSYLRKPKDLETVGFYGLRTAVQELQGSTFCWRNEYTLSLAACRLN
jgi:hypothetical protein